MTTFTLPWTQNLACLASAMDDEHRELLARINTLLVVSSTTDESRILMAFSALTVEAQAHFAREESKMDDAGYPDRLEHRMQHQHLLGGLARLRYSMTPAKNLLGAMAPFFFLERWFVPHLTQSDRKFEEFLALRTPAHALETS